MAIREFTIASANGRDTLKGWTYTPLDKPKGIIQLVHGFGEHSRRYLHMIGLFQEAGYVVYADDHIGHGKTGYDSGTLGDPGTSGLDGYRTYLDDEKQVHDLAVKEFPGIPFLMFGHSWGSMIARGYAALYGEDLAGVCLCGVVSGMKGCEIMIHDKEFENVIASGQGAQRGGDWMAKCFVDMDERFDDGVANGWICDDPRVVADHAADPFNCFDPTVQLLYDLVKLSGVIEADDRAKQVPAHVPAYLIAGDCDPCGNYGEGLYHVANMLIETGHKATVKAYSGWRHEIHNCREIRDEVVQGIVDFFDGAIK